ncbi:hypothetical protein EAL2_808p06080 (plasmid) [Peptoclostridium acidaminophilum DSM 3953]|uniref:Lipoprotein n=1 Tax=Peptoclostridium acidaminophilum DSM 3953 TaxID=1286171 RepID=W8UBH4_PEPAC|nr:hypothetical protein [Peptoclostridium acidaminophilum]AHM58111.1 hypothetical protein EAL2_808p06080 [Peptoclostridium acidaminophilum DSM 3953]
MKKSFVIFLTLLLVASLVACGPSKDTESGSSSQGSTEQSDSSETGSVGKIDTITELSDALSETQKQTEDIVNSYEGLASIDLFTPQLNLITGAFYDLLNIDNKDGRHEGQLFMSNYDGFIEKKGSISNFGYDNILDRDGSLGDKRGDRSVENGVFDSQKQYYKSEQYLEREGRKTRTSYHEFQRLADGTFLILHSTGYNFDSMGNPKNYNKIIYLIVGTDRYDFAVAEAEIGADFKPVLLSDTGEMTKEEARERFESSGWTTKVTGGIKDGKMVEDQ